MDYTWLSQVKLDVAIKEMTDNPLLETKITEASRAIDRLVTGQEFVVDYFALATVTDEILNSDRNPVVNQNGRLEFYPHKPFVQSLSAISVRGTPMDAWNPVDTQYVEIVRGRVVRVYVGQFDPDAVQVKVSYSGGLGIIGDTPPATNTLPMDLVELATLLSIRYYREAMGGMSDAIGIAELGTIMYSKALPVRTQLFLDAYKRILPW